MVPDRDNQQWIEALQTDGPQLEAALSDLRWLLLVGLKTALQSRPDLVESIFEDVVQGRWPRSGGSGASWSTKARDGARATNGDCPSPDEYFWQLYCKALRIGWWKRDGFVHAVIVTGHDANTLQILQLAAAEARKEA